MEMVRLSNLSTSLRSATQEAARASHGAPAEAGAQSIPVEQASQPVQTVRDTRPSETVGTAPSDAETITAPTVKFVRGLDQSEVTKVNRAAIPLPRMSEREMRRALPDNIHEPSTNLYGGLRRPVIADDFEVGPGEIGKGSFSDVLINDAQAKVVKVPRGALALSHRKASEVADRMRAEAVRVIEAVNVLRTDPELAKVLPRMTVTPAGALVADLMDGARLWSLHPRLKEGAIEEADALLWRAARALAPEQLPSPGADPERVSRLAGVTIDEGLSNFLFDPKTGSPVSWFDPIYVKNLVLRREAVETRGVIDPAKL